MRDSPGNVIYRNLANIVSILGILPLCILFHKDSYRFLIPLIVYNNIMDDLDGILAARLSIKSKFGALLVTSVCLAVCLLAAVAMVCRVVSRLDPTSVTGTGSPTNELIRHIFFLLLLAQIYGFDPAPFLILAFALHSISMLVPYSMPYMIRSLTKSTITIGLLNIALVVAWLIPTTTAPIAACFFTSFLYSFIVGGIKRFRPVEKERIA